MLASGWTTATATVPMRNAWFVVVTTATRRPRPGADTRAGVRERAGRTAAFVAAPTDETRQCHPPRLQPAGVCFGRGRGGGRGGAGGGAPRARDGAPRGRDP